MGIPAYGDVLTRKVTLPNKQVLSIGVLTAHVGVGAVPELTVSLQDEGGIATASLKTALNSTNDLRYVANMLNQVATRIDQVNEEAKDDYYEEDE